MISFLIVLWMLLVLGTLPAWPYSRSWGYLPSAAIGALLALVIALAVSGRL